MTIRELTTDDVDTYRSIRLRALDADPAAFGSNFKRETAFSDTDWRERLRGFAGRPGQVFVDQISENDAPIGVVGAGLSEQPGEAVLWGMWVDPTARGQGVGGRLIDAVKQWTAANDATSISLFVVRSNGDAISLYERAGFELQAEVGTDAPPDCADELPMIFYASAP